MKTQATTTLEEANALTDSQVSSCNTWLIARLALLDKEAEIALLRHQLGLERRTCAGGKHTQANDLDELSSGGTTFFLKQAGYRLLAFVGPLIVAVFLLLQLQHLSNSSVTYSLVSAIISLLFNFSSSVLLKTS